MTVYLWDEWFQNVCDDEESRRAWTAAKKVCDDPMVLVRWAQLIEINRLNRAIVKSEDTPSVGS